ncbi:hypothetical protein PC128_g19804 [Phytophthora cactorum]|nr:hypothetical protein PC128_g19804 [Phytophthora cactorum]
MRLSQVLLAIAASFLFNSEALSATMDSNQAKIAKVASTGGPSQRLLRASYTPVEEVDDAEERLGGMDKFSVEHQNILKALAKKLGFNLSQAMADTGYFSKLPPPVFMEYITMYNTIYKMYPHKKQKHFQLKR